MCHALRRNLGKAQCLAIQDPYPNGKPAVAQAKAAAPQERFIARSTLEAESLGSQRVGLLSIQTRR